MRIGVGLPTNLGSVTPDDLRRWATGADAGPFSCLAVMDRVVYTTHEPLVSLAAAAALTTRVRLVTSIVLAPTRETTLLARQAATIDAQSGGRLTLGVGVGVREDDYLATGQAFHARGRRLDEQLPLLRRLWDGEHLDAQVGVIGPAPSRQGGLELLVGGYTDAVARRIAAWGDGFMAPGGGEPEAMRALWGRILAAWSAAGRAGTPRWVGASYYALGPDAEAHARAYMAESYAFDPALQAKRLRTIPLGEAAVRDVIARQADLGAGELILRPVSPALDQLDRLADVVSGG